MSRYAARRDKLRRAFRKAGVDALLVTNFTNVTYLTGFSGDDSYLLLLGSEELIVSDPPSGAMSASLASKAIR